MVSGFFTFLYYVFLFCLVSSLVTRFVRLTKLYLSVILHKRLATLISTKRGVPYVVQLCLTLDVNYASRY